MQVGDIVKHFLTDQLGVVLDIKPLGSIHVVWTTQGESLFGLISYPKTCGIVIHGLINRAPF